MTNWIVSYKKPSAPHASVGSGCDMKKLVSEEAAIIFALKKIKDGYIVEANTTDNVKHLSHNQLASYIDNNN